MTPKVGVRTRSIIQTLIAQDQKKKKPTNNSKKGTQTLTTPSIYHHYPPTINSVLLGGISSLLVGTSFDIIRQQSTMKIKQEGKVEDVS